MKAALYFLLLMGACSLYKCDSGILGFLEKTLQKSTGQDEAGMKIKFSFGLDPAAGKEYMYPMPLNKTAALAAGYSQVTNPSSYLPQLDMYCSVDLVICGLYDDIGYIAGLQIGIPQNLTDSIFDWKTRGFRKWGGFYIIQQYIVDEEYLSRSKEQRIAYRNTTRVLQTDGVWLTGINGERLKVPITASGIAEQNKFTEQACIPWMGKHWFYNMTKSTPCTSEDIYPWFLLTGVKGNLVATGVIVFGVLPEQKQGARNWFETPGEAAVKLIVPNGPQCLYDISGTPGVITMHVYYTATPWFIGCDL